MSGKLFATIRAEHPERVKISTGPGGHWVYDEKAGLFRIMEPNGVVFSGLNNMLDRWFGLSAAVAIGWLGVENDNSAVIASTSFLHGAGAGTAATTIIAAISPAATRTAQTVSAQTTLSQASFTSGVFVIRKVGLLATATDAGTGLIDVIGGSGGTDPYSRSFSIDLTSAGAFTLIPKIQMTAVASKAAFPSGL